MPTIVHLHTILKSTEVGISRADKVLSWNKIETPLLDASSLLHTRMEEVLGDATLTLHHVDAFCVTLGPGSYTSLRIGVAAVLGWAFATQKPVIGISVHEAIAFAAIREQNIAATPFGVALRANPMEWFWSTFTEEGKPRQEAQEQAIVAVDNAWASSLSSTPVFGLTSELEMIKAHFENCWVAGVEFFPNIFVALAYDYYVQKKFKALSEIEPFYIKNPYL